MAKTEIFLPAMGEGIIEATITKWLVKEGDRVEEDDPIVEVATEFGVTAFRAAGSMERGLIQVSIDGGEVAGISKLKSSNNISIPDFNFQIGDELRVTAFRAGYYTRPALFEIVDSDDISFLFDVSRVDSDGISDAYVSLEGISSGSTDYDPLTGDVKIEVTNETRNLTAGDIITVDVDTAGYLRKVISVKEVDGKVIIETEQAYMDELFVEKSFKLKTTLLEPSSILKSTSSIEEIAKALTDKEGYLHPLKVIWYDSNGESITKSAIEFNSIADEIRQHIINVDKDFSLTDLYGESGDNIHFYVSEGKITFKTDAVFEFDFTYEGEFTEDT